jgi:hypothetical protein
MEHGRVGAELAAAVVSTKGERRKKRSFSKKIDMYLSQSTSSLCAIVVRFAVIPAGQDATEMSI